MDPLNVFYVNRSYLLVLDSLTPNSTIKSLQNSIKLKVGVRSEDQVLLVSGGDSVDPDKWIRDYEGHGTEHNPMFLFQRTSRYERDEMSCSQDINELNYQIDDSIEQAQRLEGSGDIKEIYSSMPLRVRQCGDAAQRAVRMCARLVQEHQLLHQGWLALVSNMDESISRLKRRSLRHQQNLEKVRQQQEKSTQLLQDFETCLDQLKKITLPPSLLTLCRGAKELSTSTELSLYDWISCTDPEHSVQELVDQVREQLRTFGEADSNSSIQMINLVVEQAKNSEYREIKGINKRLTQLDHNLTNVDKHFEKVKESIRIIGQTPAHLDACSLQERVAEHRQVMNDVYETLREMRQMCALFHKSKTELLSNLRTRLNGWIVQTYERLHSCHTEMMIFEEKFTGLKHRLNLVRQIKETPVLFTAAVCEVIRRSTFQKEFLSWHSLHAERCEKFSTEEGKTRSDFSNKLEGHFLRVLFPGMFDELPVFYVKNVSSYDQSLPNISSEYVRHLRKNVSELEQFLRVTEPQVFSRLSVQDPSQSVRTTTNLRREESFFTSDNVNNMSTLNKNFPSNAWLSGVDTLDNSPSTEPTLRMGNSPHATGEASSSVNIHGAPSLHQLAMLGEEEEGAAPLSVSLAKSAPIKIPVSSSREVSEKSSQFSTPDDHFIDDMKNDDGSGLQQFPVDDLTTRSQSLEFLKPVVVKIVSLSKSLLDIRADIVNDQDKFSQDFAKILELTQKMATTKLTEVEEKYAHQLSERDATILELTDELNKKSTNLDETTETLTKLRSDSESRSKEVESELESLRNEVAQFESKLKDAENEVFKRLTIEYELQAEKQRVENDDLLEEKENEIRQLKRELQSRKEEVEFLKADPAKEEFRKQVTADIRAELEKEFKGKIDLISKGMEQKRDETINRLKKELDLDLKMESARMETAMKWLRIERDQLKDWMEQSSPEAAESANVIQKDIESRMEEEEKKHVIAHFRTTQTQTNDMEVGPGAYPVMSRNEDMIESQYPEMKESTFQVEDISSTNTTPEDEVSRSELRENDLSSVKENEKSVQTRIGLRSLEMMVSIQDISEGSTVLVIWDERHNAYILFSAAPLLHFVKESSVRRLGLALPNTPRRNWILGKVAHLDLCLIRKATNRYCLPEGTRVWRVVVDPVTLEPKSNPPAEPIQS